MQIIPIDGLGPLNFILFILLLELVIWNLNIKEGHAQFWGTFSASLHYIYQPLTKYFYL